MVKTIPVGGSGLLLSRMALGMWRSVKAGLDEAGLAALINRSVELGIHTFDHADIYGCYEAQALFGRALARSGLRRDQVTLVSKCGIRLVAPSRPENRVKHYDASGAHIRASVEQTLRDLGTDHLDLLLLHRPDALADPAEVAAAFRALRRSGQVLHFGVSNHSPSQVAMLQAHLDEPLAAHQVELSLLQRAPLGDGVLDQCQQLGITPMAWSPLAGGRLSGFAGGDSDDAALRRLRPALRQVGEEIGARTAEQVALAWLLRHPAGVIPVLGTSQAANLAQAAAAAALEMDRQPWYALLEAATGQAVA
jgi:predicted oxidoreductase